MIDMRRASTRFALLALVLPLVSGCIFFQGPVSRQMQKSPNFKEGYSDGCATAGGSPANMRETTDIRDKALFRTDKAYRAGWSAGYTACRPVNATATPQSGPIPDPYPPR
jgi:hypothetical protein